MSFSLFNYLGTAMKITVYSFRPRLVVWQDQQLQFGKNQIFCLEKMNLLAPPIQAQFFKFLWDFANVFSFSVPTKLFYSLFCSRDVTFSYIFLNIYRSRKNKTIS